MFLNINPHRNNHKLVLDYNKNNNTKGYLSSLNKYKTKSYSTSSLNEEFQHYKQQNSLTNSRLNHESFCQQRGRVFSPVMHRHQQEQRLNFRNQRNIKAPEFKRTYLNLDTKLNKCTITNKDYFKPPIIEQQPCHHYQQKYERNPQNNYNLSNQKKQQINERQKDNHYKDQLSKLREQNMIIKLENQELRKQRNIDLELIARQNQVIKGQDQLMIANQNKIRNLMNQNNYEQMTAYSFRHQEPMKSSKNSRPLQCQDCLRRQTQQKVGYEFNQLRNQKFQQQKKLMKKQIHELVYQCEKLKQAVKRAEEKYDKELEQNQKLVKIIYQQDDRGNVEGNKKKHQKNIREEIDYYEPTSIKKQTQKYLFQRKDVKEIESPKYDSSKLGYYKSAASLLRFTNQENEKLKNSKVSQISSPKNLDWCESDNIKKYLKQINQQKIKQIDQIGNLLKFS